MYVFLLTISSCSFLMETMKFIKRYTNFIGNWLIKFSNDPVRDCYENPVFFVNFHLPIFFLWKISIPGFWSFAGYRGGKLWDKDFPGGYTSRPRSDLRAEFQVSILPWTTQTFKLAFSTHYMYYIQIFTFK